MAVSLMDTNFTLEVKDLSIDFITEEGNLSILQKLNFGIQPGEIFALVGESGCGKSMTALALTRLLPSNLARFKTGNILFGGKDLASLQMSELQRVRGKEIAYVFQEPFSSFDPLQKLGYQLTESYLYHSLGTEAEALKKAKYLLETVGISDPELRLEQYPNQLSGGMLQRASIAMALMTDPMLLIADEPTSAIDVTIQLQLIELILDLKKSRNLSVLFISHDIGLVSYLANRIGIMYAGKLVEVGTVDEILDNPSHPYTKALIQAYPKNNSSKVRLGAIEGRVPLPKDYPVGCHFQDRCSERLSKCKDSKPKSTQLSKTHSAECFALDKAHA